jgi:hypothetical protein
VASFVVSPIGKHAARKTKMKRILIALALSATLVAPAISGGLGSIPGRERGGPANALPLSAFTTSCTTFTPHDTLNARSLPDGKTIVGEFTSGSKIRILDSKQMNRHPWAFVTGSSNQEVGDVSVTGWVYAEYLTRCRNEAFDGE